MEYDVVIIGGGIVGMATALNLIQKDNNLKIVVLEKEKKLAAHQTGNNSGVIHSGIYYKPGSLKATNCIDGYNRLITYATEKNIPFNLCGKVIVASNESELPALESIYNRGIENGLTDLKKLNKKELKEIEPHVTGVAGIFVPQTGIIDYKVVTNAYASDFMILGGEIKKGEEVTSINLGDKKSTVSTKKSTYNTTIIVNCAGLYSDKIASFTEKNLDVRIIPFRGEYYELKPEKHYLVKTLIYPVPDPNFPFLGVHFTNMIGGGVECGPNAVFAFKKEGYNKTDFDFSEFISSVSWPGFRKVIAKYWKTGLGEYKRSFSKKAFVTALQKLLPELQESDLIPGGAGVRAQACDRQGGLIDDFKIIERTNIIHVLNAPSPAATSSLSIGNHVSELVINRLR